MTEEDEYHELMMWQGRMLTRIADALNGPKPMKNMAWSHHDLGEKAEALVAQHAALIARMRAGLRFISPDDITPMGVRMLEKILDEAELSLDDRNSGCHP